jgi:hypothetical protein
LKKVLDSPSDNIFSDSTTSGTTSRPQIAANHYDFGRDASLLTDELRISGQHLDSLNPSELGTIPNRSNLRWGAGGDDTIQPSILNITRDSNDLVNTIEAIGAEDPPEESPENEAICLQVAGQVPEITLSPFVSGITSADPVDLQNSLLSGPEPRRLFDDIELSEDFFQNDDEDEEFGMVGHYERVMEYDERLEPKFTDAIALPMVNPGNKARECSWERQRLQNRIEQRTLRKYLSRFQVARSFLTVLKRR